MSFHWRGQKSFQDKIDNLEREMKKKVPKAMTKVVKRTHAKTIPVTPRDTGEMRKTSVARVGGKVVSKGTFDGTDEVASVENMGMTLTGKVAFRTDYAVEVHESPDRNWTTPGTGAKFLENTSVGLKDENRQEFRNILKE